MPFQKSLTLHRQGRLDETQMLSGRATSIPAAQEHFVFHRPLDGPFPDGLDWAMFGMGCFWGAERLFWRCNADRIWITSVGYAGGHTPHPTYEEICSGLTGHAEVVRIGYDRRCIAYDELLKLFWNNHDPTQGMRQGNDIGTQYRSCIYAFNADDLAAAQKSQGVYERLLAQQGFGVPTTEIRPAPEFYFAEAHHQQYLAKNPHGYCNLGGLGIAYPAPDRTG